jgi:hypothetical protein
MIIKQINIDNGLTNWSLWIYINRKDLDGWFSTESVAASFKSNLIALFCGGHRDNRFIFYQTRYLFCSQEALCHFLFLCEAWALTLPDPRAVTLPDPRAVDDIPF